MALDDHNEVPSSYSWRDLIMLDALMLIMGISLFACFLGYTALCDRI